ncbi:cysteine desulfurase [Aulographum hederae CBS 113979]|uniref:Cysteine desulfurase n=1 Tax=Aulographum hederae CBS 113979 TaxID=1176131 RepID=A0A6G1GNH6_9PEZI|nr:cysteine desulfurase [Aulographum hederae CBS 113979]
MAQEPLDIATARSQFPALRQDQVFFDNAGGSQILGSVINSVTKYLSSTNVQLGATYATGRASTSKVVAGHAAGARYVNAETDEVVFGSSTTQLLRNLSHILNFPAGSELVLSSLDHEANIAPWVALAARHNYTIKWWTCPKGTKDPLLTPDNLAPLLSSKTRLVACTHASNILGSIHDIRALSAVIRKQAPDALFVVDGVAFAPHRAIDMKDMGVDVYCFSWYKVYGPHVAMMYVRRDTQEKLDTLGHYFHPRDAEHMLGCAGGCYESVQAVGEIVEYLGGEEMKKRRECFEKIAKHEKKLQACLLDYLNSRNDVTIFGWRSADPALRVPTVSFQLKGHRAQDVVEAIEGKSNFGFRWGHFYSKRLVETVLGTDEQGVIRVSMVHYNSLEEVKRFIEALKEHFPGPKAMKL